MDFARSTHPGVQAQLDRLSMVSPAGDRLGLERIRDLLDRLGRPQDRLPPVFHVAGTNGKGSTVAFLRAALDAAGHRVHVFTSPHLVRFNERIRIAGTLIGDDELEDLLTEVIAAGADIRPSFFEVATAAALLAFARTPADACILEVGLGGRLDATNVIDKPAVCGIANLARDHQQYLGHRLTDIAAEKAAIAKPGVPLLTLLYKPAIAERVGQVAKDAGAIWLPRGGAWTARIESGTVRYRDHRGILDFPLPRLPGRHQATNAALAIAMLRHQDAVTVPKSALIAAAGWTDWPARLQSLSDGPLTGKCEVWLDGGHNPAAAQKIAEFASVEFADGRPLHLIFASLKSKDPRGMLKPFAGLAAYVHTVAIPGHDSFTADELARIATGMGFDADAYEDVTAAMAGMFPGSRVLIFGSLYLAGVVLALNDQAPD
jgi:dihydrofolate synthase/folylpolyglutamate synthase